MHAHRLVFSAFFGLLFSLSGAFGQEAPQSAPSRFEKLRAVLREMKIEQEPSFGDLVAPFDGLTTRLEFESRLKLIDPSDELRRYASWDDEGIRVFLDRDEKRVEDFHVRFAREDMPRELRVASPLTNRLAAVRNNSKDLPLKGLRVAIDAGHMNSGVWDRRTGKFVERGRKFVSEGFINLMTARSLRRQLERLGAEVHLTRENGDPVASGADYDHFDMAPYQHAEFIAESDQPWFEKILSQFELGPQLLSAALNAEGTRKIFGETRRLFYFMHRADLAARAIKANAIDPDLNVVIHYDASSESPNIPIANVTRTYIMGNVMPSEAASREDRALVLRELLDPAQWDLSLEISKKMVRALSKTINVPMKDTPTDIGSIRAAEGVYARNLGLTRRIHRGLLTYFECAMYENHKEFLRMLRHDSRNGDYPARADQVARGLTRGILDFFGHRDASPVKEALQLQERSSQPGDPSPADPIDALTEEQAEALSNTDGELAILKE